jgi:hypothetical protein
MSIAYTGLLMLGLNYLQLTLKDLHFCFSILVVGSSAEVFFVSVNEKATVGIS